MAEELTGAQKAAMLIMSLEEGQAATLLQHMSEGSLAKLRLAAESLEVSKIQEDQKRMALFGFFQKQRKGGLFLGDADERFRRIVTRAKGEEGARQMYAGQLEEEIEEQEKRSPLEVIEEAPEGQIARILEKESARCVAVLLAKLSGQKAGRVLNLLEEQFRESIVERIISSQSVPAEVADQVILGFKEKLEEFEAEGEVRSDEKRAEELSGMIATLDKESQERVLSQIHERDPEMADRIERLMFGFADLVKVGTKSMQELLRNVEVAQIALALKGAPDEIQQHFFANMSQRAKERVEEEREMAGRVPLSQVEEAREEIMRQARRMYREGDLVVEIGDEQYVE